MGEEVLQQLAQKEGDKSKIESDDIQKALKDGFFDNSNTLVPLVNELKNQEDILVRSFHDTLQKAYDALKYRNPESFTREEKALQSLYAYVQTFGPNKISSNLISKVSVSNNESVVEKKELSEYEKKLQIETILQVGQYYMKFLQDSGIMQPHYEGDNPNHVIYYNALQEKYSNGEKLKKDEIQMYIHQIFPDISTSGAGYSAKASGAYKEIDKILTSKEGRNKKDIKNKVVNLLYQIRQIDDTKGMYYRSTDMLLDTLIQDVGKCKLQRGPEPWKLNNSLMQFNFLKPLENGEFTDPEVKKMYEKLKNPSKDIEVYAHVYGREGIDNQNDEYGDSAIFAVFKKYNLPSEGASNKDMYDLQLKLVSEIAPLVKKETEQKTDIKKNIIDAKSKEIEAQKQQKEILKKEFQKQNTDITNPIAQQALGYFDQQIDMNTKLINGESIKIATMEGGERDITLDEIVTEQYKSIMTNIIQKGLIYEILHQNKDTINFLREQKKSGIELTPAEKTIDMLADITGAGEYRSDQTFNTAVEVSKELVIQVALMAISGGIANIAAKGTLLALQGGAKIFEVGSYAARVARYTNMSKTAFLSSIKLMPELFAADIIAEGTVFHLANTTLNAPLQGLSADEYFKRINPFGSYKERQADGTIKEVSSLKGYAESIAFMGVMKSFGSLTNQVTKALGGETLSIAQQSQTIKNILTANLITLPGEIVAMQGTSVLVGISFGNEVDLTPQSRAQTLAMIIGLRVSHMGTGSINKITENIESNIQKNSMKQGTIDIGKITYDKAGNVQVVEYRVIDGEGKIVDEGIASKETIEQAMKADKTPKELLTINGQEFTSEVGTLKDLESIYGNSDRASEDIKLSQQYKNNVIVAKKVDHVIDIMIKEKIINSVLKDNLEEYIGMLRPDLTKINNKTIIEKIKQLRTIVDNIKNTSFSEKEGNNIKRMLSKELNKTANLYDNYLLFISYNLKNIDIGDMIVSKDGKKFTVKEKKGDDIIMEDKVTKEKKTISQEDQDWVGNIKKKIDLSKVDKEKESIDVVDALWNGDIKSEIIQGYIGDCSSLSAIQSMKQTPLFVEHIRNMVVPVENGRKVKFQGTNIVDIDPNNPGFGKITGQTDPVEIIITHQELYDRKIKNIGVSSIYDGDIILERALVSLLQYRKTGSSKDIYTYNEGKNLALENIPSQPIFEEFFGPKNLKTGVLEGKDINLKNIKAIKSIATETMTASSLKKGGNTEGRADNFSYTVLDVNNKNQSIFYSHRYYIGEIDYEKGQITVINPHNTSIERIVLSFDSFGKSFDKLYSVKIDSENSKYNKIDESYTGGWDAIETEVKEITTKEAYTDPNLTYYNNKILDNLGKINEKNIGNPEVKSAILKYFEINKSEIDPENIELEYNPERGGITIKTKSLYEQMLLGERKVDVQQKIIKNRKFIQSLEQKCLAIIKNPPANSKLEKLIQEATKKLPQEEVEKMTPEELKKREDTKKQAQEAAKKGVLDEISKTEGEMDEFQKSVLNTLLLVTGGGLKYSIPEKINGFDLEPPVKIGESDVVTMLDSPLSQMIVSFGSKNVDAYKNTENHEFQHQETKVYTDQLLTGKIQGKEGTIYDPNNELEQYLFLIKDEVISHLRNQLDANGNIDFAGITKNLTTSSKDARGYVYKGTPEEVAIYNAKVKEYVKFVEKNYTGGSKPSREAIKDIMEKLFLDGEKASVKVTEADRAKAREKIVEIVKANAKLNDQERIATTKKLPGLENITKEQTQAILDAHNVGADREGAGVYNYTKAELLQKIRILEKAGLDGDQRRVLLENGICGQVEAKMIDTLEGNQETIEGEPKFTEKNKTELTETEKAETEKIDKETITETVDEIIDDMRMNEINSNETLEVTIGKVKEIFGKLEKIQTKLLNASLTMKGKVKEKMGILQVKTSEWFVKMGNIVNTKLIIAQKAINNHARDLKDKTTHTVNKNILHPVKEKVMEEKNNFKDMKEKIKNEDNSLDKTLLGTSLTLDIVNILVEGGHKLHAIIEFFSHYNPETIAKMEFIDMGIVLSESISQHIKEVVKRRNSVQKYRNCLNRIDGMNEMSIDAKKSQLGNLKKDINNMIYDRNITNKEELLKYEDDKNITVENIDKIREDVESVIVPNVTNILVHAQSLWENIRFNFGKN